MKSEIIFVIHTQSTKILMQPTSNNSMKNLSQQAYYSYLNLLKLGQTWSKLLKLLQTMLQTTKFL